MRTARAAPPPRFPRSCSSLLSSRRRWFTPKRPRPASAAIGFSSGRITHNDYRYYDGTSMATPHVAAACALVWVRYPTRTHQQVIERVFSTVDPLPGPAGITKTGGRLNLQRALAP